MGRLTSPRSVAGCSCDLAAGERGLGAPGLCDHRGADCAGRAERRTSSTAMFEAMQTEAFANLEPPDALDDYLLPGSLEAWRALDRGLHGGGGPVHRRLEGEGATTGVTDPVA